MRSFFLAWDDSECQPSAVIRGTRIAVEFILELLPAGQTHAEILANYPGLIVEWLRRRNHDLVWARTDCPGLKDRPLIERAEADGRIIFTLDKDFVQIALDRPVRLRRCGVILFRVFPAIPERLKPLVDTFLSALTGCLSHQRNSDLPPDPEEEDRCCRTHSPSWLSNAILPSSEMAHIGG